MRCPSCGHETSDGLFCEWCGKPLATKDAQHPESPAAAAAAGAQSNGAAPGAKDADKPDSASSDPRWYRIVWGTLAIVLYVSIADAAIETFVRQSSLRWWIAGAAALYFVLCAAVWRLMPGIWRRTDWAMRATVSLVVVLALLSASAWMPDGLEQGLSLFGQTTSTVLAVVSAVLVVLSGVFLVRLPFIPLPGKIVAGLLAGYGVAAFLLAVRAGTPFASLFHGGSQWTRLPFWLQGATLGGLLLVPLALLLEIATGIRRITRDKRSEFAFKLIALSMGLAITFAAIRMPADDASAATATATANPAETPTTNPADTPTITPAGTENGENPAPDEARYKLASQRLSRIMAGADVMESKIDRSLFEINALADRLGSDPTAMFHFVRDEIRYEPYTGALRGALGTLLCRAGNSLDRSLLLAALLQKGGLKTQIVTGPLSAQQAQILVGRLFEPVKPTQHDSPSFADLAPELARAIGVDPAKLVQTAEEAQKKGDQQQKELINYVDGETTLLSNLLNKAGVDAGVITPSDRLLAEASEHYWVQYQDPNGQWVDMDSSLADAEPEKTLVSATNTFAPDSVPEELYHHLHITMTLRVAQVSDGKDGSTTDIVLLDQELRVADQQDVDIILANQAVPMLDLTKPGNKISQALASVKGFQTTLQVGDQSTTGKYFDLTGRVSDKLGGPVGDVVTNAGGLGGALGGLGGGIGGALGGAPAQGAARRIVGEWVDYRLISPRPKGQSPVVHNYHRDIVSPVTVKAWSASGPPEKSSTNMSEDSLRQRLIWYSELYPVSGSIIPGYAGYLQLQALSAGASPLESLLKSTYGLLPDQRVSMPPRRPIANTVLASETMYMANKLSAQFPGARSYFGNPGLISYETRGLGTPETTAFTQGYDIVTFAPRVAASQSNSSSIARQQAALLHITYGTLATRLERDLMVGTLAAQGEDDHVLNATKVFDLAQQRGIPISVLRPGAGSAQQVASISATESVKSELADDLSAQQVLVVPSKAVTINGQLQTAWWRLDRSSGELVGVGPDGRGQAMEEYITAAENVNLVICVLGAGKEVANDHISMGVLSGLMCLMSRVVGGNGTPEDRSMTVLGIMIHVVMVIAENAQPEEE